MTSTSTCLTGPLRMYSLWGLGQLSTSGVPPPVRWDVVTSFFVSSGIVVLLVVATHPRSQHVYNDVSLPTDRVSPLL